MPRVGEWGDSTRIMERDRDLRLGNVARDRTIISGEMCLEFGKLKRPRLTMWVADRINLGNEENEKSDKTHVRKRGADPPRRVLGSTDLTVDLRENSVKTGNGSCITATKFSNGE